MLRKFKVSNFKSFKENFELDLTDINGYEFNKDSIKNEIVNNALIYGQNGVGKSNLALAIFDIIEHLTDYRRDERAYKNYLNAYSESNVAEFYYEFLIDSKNVIYEYKKTDYKTITYEKFSIEGEELVIFDRKENSNATIRFKGAETLKTNINSNELSILKYIKSNAELDSNEINLTFNSFFKFIEGMLYYKRLDTNNYLGLTEGNQNVLAYIIKKGKTKDFELFLNEAGVECNLAVNNDLEKDTLMFDFNGKKISFEDVASSGTKSLIIFYYWLQLFKEESKINFIFIDEFDAFYHHSLSKLVIRKLKEIEIQFILTTHNTSIMTNDLLRPDCYFLMDKKQIRSLSRSTSKELREAHNIEKMYKAGSFNV